MSEAVNSPSIDEVVSAYSKEKLAKVGPDEVKAILARNGIRDLDDLVRETLDAIRTDHGAGTVGKSTFIYTHAIYKTSARFDQDMIDVLQDRMKFTPR